MFPPYIIPVRTSVKLSLSVYHSSNFLRQLCVGKTSAMSDFDIRSPGDYNYLNQSSVSAVDGIDDAQDFQETMSGEYGTLSCECLTPSGVCEISNRDYRRP